MAITIQKGSGYFIVSYPDGQSKTFPTAQISLGSKKINGLVICTLQLLSDYQPIFSSPFSDIINGDTGLPFGSYSDLQSYVQTNFFLKAGSAISGLLPINSRELLFGNSLMSMSDYETATASQRLNSGFMTFANLISNNSFYQPVGYNLGVSGQTTTQMLARLGSALALNPKVVIIEAGTNDLNASATLASIQANITSIINGFLSINAQVIVSTIFPRFGAYALSAPNEANRVTYNAWLLSLSIPGLITFNAESLGLASTDFQEGLHLNVSGSYKVGKPIGDILTGLVRPGKISAALTADNIYTKNVYLAGTGGSVSGGASGQIANNITLNGNSLGATVVGSIETINNEVGQRVNITGTYTATANQSIDMSVDDNTLPAVGDLIEGMVEYEILINDPNVICLDWFGGPFTSGFSAIAQVDSFKNALAESNPLVTGRRYITRTPSIVVLAGSTPAYLLTAFKVVLKNGTAVPINFSYKVYKIAFRKVPVGI